MGRIMKHNLESMEIKKQTMERYELLLKKEREQLTMQQLQKKHKQQEMKRLHDLAEAERLYKSEQD
jgi:hypothetical protein